MNSNKKELSYIEANEISLHIMRRWLGPWDEWLVPGIVVYFMCLLALLAISFGDYFIR